MYWASAKVLPIFITHKEQINPKKKTVPIIVHNSHCYLWPLAIFLVGVESHGGKIPAVLSQKSLSQHQYHQIFFDWMNCSTSEIGDGELVLSQENKEGGVKPLNQSSVTFGKWWQ